MKEQSDAIQQYTILQEKEKKMWLIHTRPELKLVMFSQKYKDKQYFRGHNILTESVFVTQVSINAEILFVELYGLQ
jgi:hypothetical protein